MREMQKENEHAVSVNSKSCLSPGGSRQISRAREVEGKAHAVIVNFDSQFEICTDL